MSVVGNDCARCKGSGWVSAKIRRVMEPCPSCIEPGDCRACGGHGHDHSGADCGYCDASGLERDALGSKARRQDRQVTSPPLALVNKPSKTDLPQAVRRRTASQ